MRNSLQLSKRLIFRFGVSFCLLNIFLSPLISYPDKLKFVGANRRIRNWVKNINWDFQLSGLCHVNFGIAPDLVKNEAAIQARLQCTINREEPSVFCFFRTVLDRQGQVSMLTSKNTNFRSQRPFSTLTFLNADLLHFMPWQKKSILRGNIGRILHITSSGFFMKRSSFGVCTLKTLMA